MNFFSSENIKEKVKNLLCDSKSPGSEDFKTLVMFNVTILFALITGLLMIIRLYFETKNIWLHLNTCLTLVLIATTIYCLRSKKYRSYSGYIILFILTKAIISAAVEKGGLLAPGAFAVTFFPLVGHFCLNKTGARISLILSFCALGILYAYSDLNVKINASEKNISYRSLIFTVGILATYGLGSAFEMSRRKTEKKNKNLSEQLAWTSKMVSLGKMASGVAHEINNPLAIVRGKVFILKRKAAKGELSLSELTTELSKVDTATQRIEKIILGLKSFSHPESGLPPGIESIGKILEDSIEACSNLLLDKQIRFNSPDIALLKTIEVACHPGELMQIVINLISNSVDAIEFLNDKWIAIEYSLSSDKIKLSFLDSGTGIDQTHIPHLMEPFFTTKPVGKGTGLGLSISKGLIEKIGGEISYDFSRANTCFCINIPLAKKQAKETQVNSAA